MNRGERRRRSRAARAASPAADRWLLPLIVAACTALAFAPALRNGFVDWDDLDTLAENPFYRGLGWPQLQWMWTTTLMGQYIPVTWMTLGLDYVLWGMDPVGYHLTSLLLHVANAGLFYLVALRLLALGIADGASANDFSIRLGAAFAALVFGVHPLRVESVAWATERRDVLCGFFWLLATLAYLRYARGHTDEPVDERKWYGISFGCFCLAVLSKSMAVTLPAVLVIIDLYPLRRLGARPRSWLERSALRVWLEKLPFFLVSAAGSVIAVLANQGNLHSRAELGVVERLAISAYQVVFYLWKTIAPVELAPLYELRSPIVALSWPFVLSAVVVTATTAFVLLARHRWPAIAAAWFASLVMLGPVSAIFHNGPQIAADRYTYLPTLPWAVLAGAALAIGWRASPRAGALVKELCLVGPAVAVAILGVLTFVQTQVWHDAGRLWSHALHVSPSFVAHYNLGVHFDRYAEWSTAIDHYRQALRIKSDPDAHYNLGVDLARQGAWNEAIAQYREVVRIQPQHAAAHYNWGIALARQDRLDEAVAHYELALRFKPDFAAAHNNWGAVLARQGRWTDAISHYQEAVRLKPDHAEAHNNWAGALAQLGRWDEAIAHFREALRIKPGFAEARGSLEQLLASQAARTRASER